MKFLISKLISILKKEPYKVDDNISDMDLFEILLNRLTQVFRGFKVRIKLKKCSGIAFIGKRVKILSGKKIIAGKSLIIEDGCFINAMSNEGIKIGTNFSLGRNSIIECTGVIRELGEGLVIGNHVGIAANAFISVRGKVTIGDDCIFGPGVSIHAENHVFDDIDIPIRLQGSDRKGITIGNNCWIGSKVTILDGVTIGNNCVIAAGAVVNKDLPDNCIAGGVPVKVLKMRGNKHEDIIC